MIVFALIMTPRLRLQMYLRTVPIYPTLLSFTSHTEPGHMLARTLSPSFSLPLSISPLLLSPTVSLALATRLNELHELNAPVHVWPRAKLQHAALWTLWACGTLLPILPLTLVSFCRELHEGFEPASPQKEKKKKNTLADTDTYTHTPTLVLVGLGRGI